MFTINAYHNPYLRVGQNAMQVILSLGVDAAAQVGRAPLALGIALDRSGSMEGPKMRAARDGAVRVVQSLDESIMFMVVVFNDNARVVFGPAPGTAENKRQAAAAIQTVQAANGTRMSTALNTIIDKFGQDRARATKILFLTDGRNETEHRSQLDRAVERCRAANISINAWGVGTDWDVAELRHMAEATYGTADIIPTPQQISTAFAESFNQIRKTALTNVRLSLWSPVGVSLKSIAQVYPTIVPLGMETDPANPRQQIISLGSFAAGEQRDYLVDLNVPVYAPGQQFLMLRPAVKYYSAGTTEVEEKSTRDGWVFVQWTENMALASQIEQHIAHYTNQEELAQYIREGQDALAAGDSARATRLLGQALDISQRSGNERITRLLSEIVQRNPDGTVCLNQRADAVARKTLAINVGHTTKLK
ncbi:MAG TPA: vWA domain-containing protein [Ktedonobacteraceae bacterium]|nr:vWA domain-containing protein [Ktedonobacteraceae bacterium]